MQRVRHWFVVSSWIGLLYLFAALQPAQAGGLPWEGELPSLAPMVEEVTPAVVNIATRQRVRIRQHPFYDDPFFRHFFDLPPQPRERIQQSLGSGVIIDAEEGLVLTNHHVIRNADEIMVTLFDGRTLEAQVIGHDEATDLALLRVEANNLQALEFGDSGALRPGDFVVAIGNPFGLGQTVTSGMVSAVGRTGLGIHDYEDFIQTDASINPGNSGGALVNLRGELVGINTAILSPGGGNIGIGFAIPIHLAEQVAEHLDRYGEVRRGRLGITAQPLTPQLAEALGFEFRPGALVTHVERGTLAAHAGLQRGDVILAIDGRQIRNISELRVALGLMQPGTGYVLEVMRDGERQEVEITVPEG